MLDYIIVGQGIAGSLLSWFLLLQQQKVLVIDKYNPSSSSNIAAGLIKPITGKRFVKTWMADEIIPFAEETYTAFQKVFDDKFFEPVVFFNLLDSVKAQNDWSIRCTTPDYYSYLKNDNLLYLDASKVKNDFGGFEINGGSRLEADKFLSHYRKYLAAINALRDESFDFNKLQLEGDCAVYGGEPCQKIIFAEGASATQNPYFGFLPFQLAKGECLIVRMSDFVPEYVINGEVVIVPVGKDLYYIGATHEWHFDDDQPSEKGRNELLGNLSSLVNIPVEVVSHKAAIRPTVKDRRPFIGLHPEFPALGIFNGMGTKGVSLAPYFAKQFAAHLVYGKPLHSEVGIKRFVS